MSHSKILVVEDDDLLVKVLERLLMVSGFDVRSTPDGEAALELVRDDRAVDMLGKSYKRLAAKGIVESADLNEDRSSMADVPEGAICYENPIGTAPAVRLRIDETTFFLLPGVPEEMRELHEEYTAGKVEIDRLEAIV